MPAQKGWELQGGVTCLSVLVTAPISHTGVDTAP
jgi:hypothetical protein